MPHSFAFPPCARSVVFDTKNTETKSHKPLACLCHVVQQFGAVCLVSTWLSLRSSSILKEGRIISVGTKTSSRSPGVYTDVVETVEWHRHTQPDIARHRRTVTHSHSQTSTKAARHKCKHTHTYRHGLRHRDRRVTRTTTQTDTARPWHKHRQKHPNIT